MAAAQWYYVAENQFSTLPDLPSTHPNLVCEIIKKDTISGCVLSSQQRNQNSKSGENIRVYLAIVVYWGPNNLAPNDFQTLPEFTKNFYILGY